LFDSSSLAHNNFPLCRKSMSTTQPYHPFHSVVFLIAEEKKATINRLIGFHLLISMNRVVQFYRQHCRVRK
jgi:hypothetical protein